MLVLTRRIGEKVLIGKDIEVTVTGVRGRQVRIGLVAPESVRVARRLTSEGAQSPSPPALSESKLGGTSLSDEAVG